MINGFIRDLLVSEVNKSDYFAKVGTGSKMEPAIEPNPNAVVLF